MNDDTPTAGTKPDTLGDALPRECERVRELIPMYESIGPNGMFGLALIREALRKADRAMISGDLVGMIAAYQDLRGFSS